MTNAESTTDKTGPGHQPANPENLPLSDRSSTGIVEESSSEIDAEYARTEVQPPQESDVAPDGGYGWVCVFCVFMINAHTWGINSVGHSVAIHIVKLT